MLDGLRDAWRDAATGDTDAWWGPPLRLLHIPWLVLRDAFRDNVHVRSGFVALWCIEALVPLLVLAAALAAPLGYDQAMVRSLWALLDDSIFGETADTMVAGLRRLLRDAGLAQLGIAGVITSMFIGWQLFVAAVYDLNDLSWTRMGHTGGTHIVQFLGFLLWTAALLVGGTAASAAAWQALGWYAIPLPILGTTLVLALGLRLFTRRALTWPGAFVGGLAGALWWEMVKSWFWFYTTSSFGTDSLSSIYQALGFIPIFLFWMHLTWFSVFLGAVAARQYDHHEVLWRHHLRMLRGEKRLALREDVGLVRAVWGALERGAGSLAELAERLDVHPSHVATVLSDLEDIDRVIHDRAHAYCRAEDYVDEAPATTAEAWREAFTAHLD